MAKITIRDVGEKAGVSLGTVSRVLNNAENVAPEIYEKTMLAIKALDYRPIRQSASWRKSQQQKLPVGVLFPEMSEQWYGNPFFFSYMKGIEKICRQRGRNVVMFMKDDVMDLTDLSEKTSGILLKTNFPNPKLIDQLSQDVPIVGLNMLQPQFAFPQISFDNYAAGILATQELIDSGHKKIAFINNEPHHPMFIARSRGYCELMRQNDLFDTQFLIEYNGNNHLNAEPLNNFPNMDFFLKKVLGLGATAVIAANDWMALGFYESCRKEGVIIPDNISCIGFDDTESARNKIVSPRLSTVAMPFEDVASLATNILLDLVDGLNTYLQNLSMTHYLPGKFINRESIKKLHSSLKCNGTYSVKHVGGGVE